MCQIIPPSRKMSPLPSSAIYSMRLQDLLSARTAMAPVLSCQWVEEKLRYVQFSFLTRLGVSSSFVACEHTT